MTSQMEYPEAAEWLSSLELFGVKMGLEQTRELFDRLGNPHLGLKFIHVAGTNGKGSVCALIEGALRRAGFRTGLYTSPHLIDVRERFRVSGRAMPESAFACMVSQVKPHIEAMREKGMQPTYFEVTTAMAALHFSDLLTDFVVWETGMGGRLDATNVVPPVCTVISGVSLEHQQHLGSTLSQIAAEKAGIIKRGVPVVCGQMPDEALSVVASVAAKCGAPLLPPDPFDEPIRAAYEIPGAKGRCLQRFVMDSSDFELSLLGPHQRRNAALSFRVLRLVSEISSFDCVEAAGAAFASAKWPARLQFMPERRLIIDGAHNPEAAASLAISLAEILPNEKFEIFLGCFEDKAHEAMLKELLPVASSFAFLKPASSRRPCRSPEELSAKLMELSPSTPCRESSLMELAKPCALNSPWRLLCGSIHLCGEALATISGPESALDL